eukprot:8833507-Alexandrium_andersonii.AAC.1
MFKRRGEALPGLDILQRRGNQGSQSPVDGRQPRSPFAKFSLRLSSASSSGSFALPLRSLGN